MTREENIKGSILRRVKAFKLIARGAPVPAPGPGPDPRAWDRPPARPGGSIFLEVRLGTVRPLLPRGPRGTPGLPGGMVVLHGEPDHRCKRAFRLPTDLLPVRGGTSRGREGPARAAFRVEGIPDLLRPCRNLGHGRKTAPQPGPGGTERPRSFGGGPARRCDAHPASGTGPPRSARPFTCSRPMRENSASIWP